MTSGQVFSATFPATVSGLPESRQFIHGTLRSLGLETYETDIQLALGEVMQNIIRHGYGGGDALGSITMKIRFNNETRRVCCWIRDTASPAISANLITPVSCRKPHEGGIGLHLIHALCEKYEITAGKDGNLFSVVIRLAGSGAK